MLSRYRRLRGNDRTVLVWTGLVWLGTTALNVMQYAERPPLLFGVGIGVVVAGVFFQAETLVRDRIAQAEAWERESAARDVREREKRRRIAKSLIEDAFKGSISTISKSPDKTGGVLFLPDDQGRLKATYTYNKAGKPDQDIEFAPFEGCAGHAWMRGRQTMADLSRATDNDLEERWKLSPQQISRTAHLKTVVATPVWSEGDPEQKLGVVTIDSEVANDECGLMSKEAADGALQLAKLMAGVIRLGELV